MILALENPNAAYRVCDLCRAQTPTQPGGRPGWAPLPEIVVLIGVRPDTEVAALAGVSRVTVAKWRRRHGTQRASVSCETRLDERHPGLRALLGVETDGTVAARYCLSRERIRQLRSDLGVTRAKATGYHYERMRWRPEPEVEVLIGVKPDTEVAKLAGVVPATIARWRRNHATSAAPRARWPDRQWANSLELRCPDLCAAFGTASDGELARRYGSSIEGVAQARRRRGIQAWRTSAATTRTEGGP